jgi:DNA-binding response OmpR family regulator
VARDDYFLSKETMANRLTLDSDKILPSLNERASAEAEYVVFVVDDEIVISTTLSIILTRAGFKAFSFTHPKHAIAASQLIEPDLLISDVSMPEMTGIELAVHFRQAQSQCRILLFSGQAETTDLLKHARNDGYDFDLVHKPIHPSDLLAKCNAWRGSKSHRLANSRGSSTAET